MPHLTKDQRRDWTAKGFVAVPRVLDDDGLAALTRWIDEIAEPAGPHARRLHYFEQTAHGRTLCRTERFIEDHAGLASLVCGGIMREIGAELVGEPVLLYKEKINYKAPGGGGYAPHQDAPAYTAVDKLVTCLLAIDDMTEENGCLDFASHAGTALLPVDVNGCIDRATAAALRWESVPIAAGSALYFTAYAPHRSAGNRTARSRRALYLTYHAAAEGALRASYYAWRDDKLAQAAAEGKARVSTIGDFLGRIVP